MQIRINELAKKTRSKEISTQGLLALTIERSREDNGLGMGVLSDGTPYLNQRGLAGLCGVQNAHIGTISSQWADTDPKPRIQTIKAILAKIGPSNHAPHIEIPFKGIVHFCYPADVCLAILEYYALDAGQNTTVTARENYRKLAGSKLKELIYSQVGYDPSGQDRFALWHERLAMNYQSAPRGFFHVFNEASTLIYELIEAGAKIDSKFVVDISIGQHWSKYWEESGLAELYDVRRKYPHKYPDSHPQSKSNPQESWCYPLAALGEFRRWLQDEYIDGGKFRNYLAGKVKQGLLPPSIAELALGAVEVPRIG